MLDSEAPEATILREQVYRTIHQMLRDNYANPSPAAPQAPSAPVAEVPGMRMTTQFYSDVIGGDFNHERLAAGYDS